jgi:hypothetical protein
MHSLSQTTDCILLSSSNAIGLYLGGIQFKTHPNYQPFLPRLFVVPLSCYRNLGKYSEICHNYLLPNPNLKKQQLKKVDHCILISESAAPEIENFTRQECKNIYSTDLP